MDIAAANNNMGSILQGMQTQDASLMTNGITGAAQQGANLGKAFSDSISSLSSPSSGTYVSNKGVLIGNDAFSKMTSGLLDGANKTILESEIEQRKILAGESDNIQGAIIKMNEASLITSLSVSIGNKLQECYKAIIQIPA